MSNAATSLLALSLLALGSGCATQVAPEVASAVGAGDELHGCAVAYPVADPNQAIVVEGFGGAEEAQMLVTARKPVARCAHQVVQAREARLHPLP